MGACFSKEGGGVGVRHGSREGGNDGKARGDFELVCASRASLDCERVRPQVQARTEEPNLRDMSLSSADVDGSKSSVPSENISHSLPPKSTSCVSNNKRSLEPHIRSTSLSSIEVEVSKSITATDMICQSKGKDSLQGVLGSRASLDSSETGDMVKSMLEDLRTDTGANRVSQPQRSQGQRESRQNRVSCCAARFEQLSISSRLDHKSLMEVGLL